MKKFKKLALTIALTFAAPSLAAAEVLKSFVPGRFDSDYQVTYFKSESNFASDGSQSSLPSGYSFQIIDVNLSGRYVLLNDFGLYAGLNIGSSEANDSLATRKNSSLNEAFIGADYRFYQSELMTLVGDLSYHHAIEKIAIDTDSALNNDGASQLKAQVTSVFHLGVVDPYGSVGVNYRTEGLSTLLTYSLGVQSDFDQFVLGAALNGYASVIDDSKTNRIAERDAVTNRVNAGSRKFYAINPNQLDSDLYLKYKINENFSVGVNGGYTLVGSNSAQGYHVGAVVSWGFGGENHPRRYEQKTYKPKPAPAPKNSQQKFHEDTNDGVNQDYFKPVTPSKENYIDQIDGQKSGGGTQIMEGNDDEMTTSTKLKPSASDQDYKIKLKKKKKKKKKKN